MLQFIQNNIVSIIVLTVLAVCVILAIRKIIKDKRKGIGPCGNKCSDCARICDDRLEK